MGENSRIIVRPVSGIGHHTVKCSVGPVYILRTEDTGIIRNIQSIVGHEEIIIAIMINNLRCFGPLPAVVLCACKNQLAVGGFVFRSPWNTLFGKCLARVTIEPDCSNAAMPRTIDEPVLALGSYDIGRVNGIKLEIAVLPSRHIKVQSLVRIVGNDISLVDPRVSIGRSCRFHEPDKRPLAP